MKLIQVIALAVTLPAFAQQSAKKEEARALKACADLALQGFPKIAATRDERFEAKVTENAALCRGGQRALLFRNTPWVDWSQYWGARDASSRAPGLLTKGGPSFRGVSGALLDLEYQRIELIKFNLFDNNDTFSQYISGSANTPGPSLKVWPEMRLAKDNPNYLDVGGDGKQVCSGNLVRARTVSGICNDVVNPLMGSTGTPFARNVEFDSTFPDLGRTELTRNRHGDRLGLLKPDPQVISRKLFTRPQTDPAACAAGFGKPGFDKSANCDYAKAPFFNVLAAYWIQFMTHDWFTHLEEGHNAPEYMQVGCATQLVNGVETLLSLEDIQRLGCRPADRIDKSYVAKSSEPAKFTANGKEYLTRAPRTTSNNNTAWWDASQLYGYDENSRKRMKRDPQDPARLLLLESGLLPVFQPDDPINPEWTGQEATADPDNWTIGLSFFHNVFAREHNAFVDQFRAQAARSPNADSGLRNPSDPKKEIRNKDVTPDELFEVARLVVSAEIAKIHTTEWTPQLLYDEPLDEAMNANWNGLLGAGGGELSRALNKVVTENFGKSKDVEKATQWYSVFASGPGIFGLGKQGSRLRHHEARIHQWRRESLRFALQFSGRVCHGIPAACAHSRSDRISRTGKRSQ